jgi:hypothetical protein
MKERIETGIRLAGAGRACLAKTGSLEKALSRFDWFYCGAEFCENLLESPGWHEEEAAFFTQRGAKVCLLTPPLSDRGLKRLRSVFLRLAAFARKDPRAAKNLEVTINDLGALELARETKLGLTLNAGRLLYENLLFVDRTKMKVINAEAVNLFAGLGIGRFEFSTTGRKLMTNFSSGRSVGFKPRDISITLYYPYLNITSARTCVMGIPDIAPEDSVTGVHCRRECEVCSLEVQHPSVKEKFTVSGNTVFLKFPEKFYSSRDSLLKRRVNRLVYCPFP